MKNHSVHYYGASRNSGGRLFMRLRCSHCGEHAGGSASAVYEQEGAQASSSASSSTSASGYKSGASACQQQSGSTSAQDGRIFFSLWGSAITCKWFGAELPRVTASDAKKNTPGDQGTAKTTEATTSKGKVVIPTRHQVDRSDTTECKAAQQGRKNPRWASVR